MDYRQAEKFVATCLKRSNWNILAENFRRIGCELDIVATKESTLIIVEVKLRSRLPENQADLEEILPARKREALKRGAQKFLVTDGNNWDTVRFDLAIVQHKKGLNKNPGLNYYVGVF